MIMTITRLNLPYKDHFHVQYMCTLSYKHIANKLREGKLSGILIYSLVNEFIIYQCVTPES